MVQSCISLLENQGSQGRWWTTEEGGGATQDNIQTVLALPILRWMHEQPVSNKKSEDEPSAALCCQLSALWFCSFAECRTLNMWAWIFHDTFTSTILMWSILPSFKPSKSHSRFMLPTGLICHSSWQTVMHIVYQLIRNLWSILKVNAQCVWFIMQRLNRKKK